MEIAQSFAVVAAEPLPLGTLVTRNERQAGAVAHCESGSWRIQVRRRSRRSRRGDSPVAMNEPLTGNNLASQGGGSGSTSNDSLRHACDFGAGERGDRRRRLRRAGHTRRCDGGDCSGTKAASHESSSATCRFWPLARVRPAGGARRQARALVSGHPSSVTPEDAELVGLASNQGKLLLTLRNPLDTQPTMSPGTRSVSLSGGVARPLRRTTAANRPVRTACRRNAAARGAGSATATKDLFG